MTSSVQWKNDAPYAVCLSHDVDRISKQWYHYLFYCKYGLGRQISSLMQKLSGDEPYYNLYKIAEMEMAYNVRSTFLFLNETHKELSVNFIGRYSIFEKKVVDAIEWLDTNGFDIGLHGSYYSYNNISLLAEEKSALEEIVGHNVYSTRQHYLNYDENTFRLQKEVGLRFDSTVGNKKTTGENLPIFPYYTNEGMIEMPITVMDTVSMRTEEESNRVFEACKNVADRGGLVMLNFHQRQLCNNEYPFITKTYLRIIENAKLDGAWLSNIREIGEYVDGRIGNE